jgi:tRNA A-37 threonylcarbamoyl transferase component Bud32
VVEGLLGRGATAVVELARDPCGRAVAVKRLALRGSGPEIDRARRRIRREAEVLQQVRHPAVLPLLAVQDDGVDVVIVTAYAQGGSLRDRVQTRGPLPAVEVIAMAGPLLGALATAHRCGIVHRDITPANVLFTADGGPLLADFGVATWRECTAGLTAEGFTVGTPGFLSPEQARGEPATAASDVFGLAGTLLYALTGVGPYGPGSPDVLAGRAWRGEIATVPDGVPALMAAELGAMLDPDPRRRPSAAALGRGPAATEIRQLPAAPPPHDPVVEGTRRWWWPVVATTATVAAAMALGTIVALTGNDGHAASSASAAKAKATTAVCQPLPYQACTQSMPAPFTNGRTCIDNHADYDGNPLNGCEAAPDTVPDGTVLAPDHPIVANIVPANEVDTFLVYLTAHFQPLCNAAASITLTAPPGVADRVEVLLKNKVVATAVSYSGQPSTAYVKDPPFPFCFHDNSGWYTVRVRSVAGNRAASYKLTVSGHL